MIDIEDIDFKLMLEYQFGHCSMPEFAFVNSMVINSIFHQGINAGHIPNTHYGFSGFSVWTRVGKLELLPCDFLKNDEVILSHSRNIILNIFYKLGLNDGKNTFYR
jgi:hypothetical protein